MFGTYRILLALMVVYLHFTGSTFFAGHYAVFGFFTLSGYLMTLILQKNYGYSLSGLAGYAVNRLLRIYPMYWVSMLLAIGVLLIIHREGAALGGKFFMPRDLTQWFQNIALFVTRDTKPQVIVVAWTLSIELFYYLLIGLGISRTRKITALWLAVSILYTGYMAVTGTPFGDRFFTFSAATMPFSMGAAMYHWKKELTGIFSLVAKHPAAPLICTGIFLANGMVGHTLGTYESYNFYLNIPLCALVHISLYERQELLLVSRNFDKFMGDLSYPLYLIHVPLGWVMLYFCLQLGLPFTSISLSAFFAFLPVTMIITALLSLLVEQRIESLRNIVKQRLWGTTGKD